MSRNLLLLFTSLFALANVASAVNVFAGCTDLESPSDASTETYQGFISTGPGCSEECTGYAYSYWASDDACYCSNAGIPAANLQTGTSGTCSGTEVRVIGTTFNSVSCLAFKDLTGQPTFTLGPSNVAGARECLTMCRNDLKAVFGTDSESSTGYSCVCSSDIQGTSNNVCGTDSVYVYNHPAAAAASGFTKRRAREEEEQRRRDAEVNPCPWGLTACAIPGLEAVDAFECIDTQNDIESCGGCIHRAYTDSTLTMTSNVGENCITPGVRLGSASCQAGKCVAYGCKDNYDLIDGQCIAAQIAVAHDPLVIQ
ncbi:uncharacterized protein L199_003569 [Kwoniella botswanensis]|uniref:uncharacterized protein n=1 Tax=Kwoniella botswanensis TaxID=1268659 RepID=UPI00315D2A66